MADINAGKPDDTDETNTGAPEGEGEGEVVEGSEEGSSGETQGDAKVGEDNGTLFFNPNDLPEELKPVFKRMQASFTRKMQMATVGVKKAQAYDQLVRDPGFRAWYEARLNGGAKPEADGGAEETEELSPQDRRIQALEMKQARDDAAREFNEFKSKHPEWENYSDQLTEMLERRPDLTYEEAFKLVAFDDATNLGSRATVQKLVDKKKANASKPSSISSKGMVPKKVGGIQGAYELAKKQLGI